MSQPFDAQRGRVTVDLPDGPISVIQRGTGPPVLLLHGIPLSSYTWRHTVDSLSRTATVCAVDLRGYGQSAKPRRADYSVPGHVDVVRRVMAELDLPAAAVVGSSFGAAVAITLAHTAPGLVTRLVLINPVCYPGGPHSAARLARIGLLSTLARPLLRHPTVGRRILAARLRHSYGQPEHASTEVVGVYHELLTRDSGEHSYVATLRQLREYDVARRVPKLAQETLVIWGGRDRVLPATDASRLATELPRGRVCVLDDLGHLPHEEDAARVNPMIANFLNTAAPPADWNH